ncbi:MAG: hypothetical protein R3261_06900, partial [Alphaproteobacteria bacterium]|nr:hypothetical protein [Alphaproteobacteria bacterium]
WGHIASFFSQMTDNGVLEARRKNQAAAWLWNELRDGLVDQLRRNPRLKSELEIAENEVKSGQQSPVASSRRLINSFLNQSS